MKKINLFNRNTNLPSYRRRPVSGGFNRGGGIPLFSGMTAVIFALFVATPSFATPTELDKKTVASKAYVDTKQDIITTGLVSLGDDWFEDLPSVVSFDSTSGLVGNKYGILDVNGSMNYIDDGWQNYIGEPEVEYLIPTVGAVGRELQEIWINVIPLTWNSAETTSTNAYDITFVGDTGATANAWPRTDKNELVNTAALAQGLALKQNKIPANNILYYDADDDDPDDSDIYVPALVVTDLDGIGLNGNTIGILNTQLFGSFSSKTDQRYDNFVPTVRAVASALVSGLALKQNKLPAKSTTTSLAPTGGQTIDLKTAAGDVGQRYITAGGNVGLTTKSTAPNIITYVNGTSELPLHGFANSTFGNNSTTYQKYITGALVSLELLKDVYSELNAKITNNALPTGTTGTVVTYNGTNATTGLQEFGERAVYDPANAYNAQNDATKLATAGFVETKQNKMVCAGWDSDTHTDEHCWLWSIE